MGKSVSPLANIHKVQPGELPHTLFNENFLMRKIVFPRTRICTVLSELLLVEINKNLCKSAQAEIRFSTCGNSHKMVHFHMRKNTKNCEFCNMRKYSFFGVKWISSCQFTSGFMNILGEKHAGKQVFFSFVCLFVLFCFFLFLLFISTCRNTQACVNSCVRKYTQKGAACGNTQNQIPKKKKFNIHTISVKVVYNFTFHSVVNGKRPRYIQNAWITVKVNTRLASIFTNPFVMLNPNDNLNLDFLFEKLGNWSIVCTRIICSLNKVQRNWDK